jgi:hypothetical protein
MKTIGNPKRGLRSFAKRLRTFAARTNSGRQARDRSERCEPVRGHVKNGAAVNLERWLSSPELRRPS